MAVYLVTYDLNKETTRPKILDKIRAYEGWARLSESSYAISTNQTSDQVYANLKTMIDGNDQLYIITIKRPYSGFGPKEINEWLEKNLPY